MLRGATWEARSPLLSIEFAKAWPDACWPDATCCLCAKRRLRRFAALESAGKKKGRPHPYGAAASQNL